MIDHSIPIYSSDFSLQFGAQLSPGSGLSDNTFPSGARMSPYAVLAVLLAFCYVIKMARASSRKLPPSPPSIPLIGHLHLLGRLPHRSLRELHARYGSDGGLLFLKLGRRRTLVVSTAAAASDLYKNHDLAFASRPPNAAIYKLTYGSKNVSFAPYGDAWRLRKKMAVVHLLSTRRAESFAPVRAAVAAALVDRSRRAADAGETVELRELLYEYSNAIVIRAATGATGATAERIRRLMGNGAVFVTGVQADDVLPDAAAKVVRWATGLEKKLDREVVAWDEFLSEIVAEHVEKKGGDGGTLGEEDFLDVLLRVREEGAAGLELTDDGIKSIVKDLIAAGTDTSAVTLQWAMAELVENPRVMAKLQDEISRVTGDKATIEEDDFNNMEYLKAVLKEVLRLHPPGPLLLPHESTMAAVVQGYEIPEKTALFINAWAIGRDPATWGDAAEEFRPERFQRGGGAAGNDLRGNDYHLIPFGAGRRVCPAISFVLPVLEIAVANLVRHFDWELPTGTRLDMSEAPGLTAPPVGPLRLFPKCRTLA